MKHGKILFAFSGGSQCYDYIRFLRIFCKKLGYKQKEVKILIENLNWNVFFQVKNMPRNFCPDKENDLHSENTAI